MYQELRKAIERPPLYKKMAEAFWDDAYISKQMLKAHLDPDFEGASRKADFIDEKKILAKSNCSYCKCKGKQDADKCYYVSKTFVNNIVYHKNLILLFIFLTHIMHVFQCDLQYNIIYVK